MSNVERELSISQLAELAMESQMAVDIDWSKLNLTKNEAFSMMAGNVIDQLEAVPDEQRPIVAMATITKLLVENFVLNTKLQGK
jgi:hypothetical protein